MKILFIILLLSSTGCTTLDIVVVRTIDQRLRTLENRYDQIESYIRDKEIKENPIEYQQYLNLFKKYNWITNNKGEINAMSN